MKNMARLILAVALFAILATVLGCVKDVVSPFADIPVDITSGMDLVSVPEMRNVGITGPSTGIDASITSLEKKTKESEYFPVEAQINVFSLNPANPVVAWRFTYPDELNSIIADRKDNFITLSFKDYSERAFVFPKSADYRSYAPQSRVVFSLRDHGVIIK